MGRKRTIIALANRSPFSGYKLADSVALPNCHSLPLGGVSTTGATNPIRQTCSVRPMSDCGQQGIARTSTSVTTIGDYQRLDTVLPLGLSRLNFREEGTQEKLQELLWQKFFSDPTQWLDYRRSKTSLRYPDFKNTKSKEVLWSDNWKKPAWVDAKLAMWDAQISATIKSPSVSLPSSVQDEFCKVAPYEGHLDLATCRKLCEDGLVSEAVDVLNLLVQQACHVPYHMFYCVLKSCIRQKDLVLGRRVHALSVENGHEGNSFLATHLVGLYASHGRLDEATGVFSKVTSPSLHNWASIIFAYARHGDPAQALGLYRQMLESTVKPDNCIFVAVLKACASAGDLAAGKDVHTHIRGTAGNIDIFVQNSLVDMYAKCGSLDDARHVFDRLPCKDVVTWNAMIAGYAQQGMGQEALRLYSSMQQESTTPPNSVTFVCLLKACACVGIAALQQGKQLHAQVELRGLQADLALGASLVNMYSKCGSLENAQRVFDRLSQKNVVSWTAMIAGYAQQGLGHQALSLYRSMQQEGISLPNACTYACLLHACASTGVTALHQGKQLHAQIEERGLQADMVVGASLVNMYAKCGSLEDAQRMFDSLAEKDAVTWSAMVAGYAQQGMGWKALSLYTTMQQKGITPHPITCVSLLQACASVGVAALHQGKQLHAQIELLGVQLDVFLGASLVNMYAKCGSLEDAQRVFDRLSQKNVVTWTTMIAGYAQQGMGQEALSLYSSMQEEGVTLPDSVIFVCLLQACASVAALPLGKELHEQIEEQGLQADVVVGASLVNMYAKCGSMVDSQRVFDSLPERDIVAWGALISGYTCHGDSEAVFDLVNRMKQEGIQPNSIMLISVLTVCSHVGLVDKGRRFFKAMSTDYGITPTVEHYTCMMDLLGRAGHLDEALQIVKTMPFQPRGAVWLSLLGACRKWNNVEVGRQAFQFAVGLDEKDAAAYVLMSNIYSGAEMWEEAEEMQARRLKCGAHKEPGQSWWTDMDGAVHSFVVGKNREHLETESIYARS